MALRWRQRPGACSRRGARRGRARRTCGRAHSRRRQWRRSNRAAIRSRPSAACWPGTRHEASAAARGCRRLRRSRARFEPRRSVASRGSASETDGLRAAEGLYNRALAEPGLEIREQVDILGRLAGWPPPESGSRDGIRYAEAGLALAESWAIPSSSQRAWQPFAELTFWRTGASIGPARPCHRTRTNRRPSTGARGRRWRAACPGQPLRGGTRALDGTDRGTSRASDPAVASYLMFLAEWRSRPARGAWRRDSATRGSSLRADRP